MSLIVPVAKNVGDLLSTGPVFQVSESLSDFDKKFELDIVAHGPEALRFLDSR